MNEPKQIGKGAFTKAFLLESGRVRLHSTDKVKECAALWGLSDSRLFPEIELVDDDPQDRFRIYEMEFFEIGSKVKGGTLGALNKNDKRIYRLLRKFYSEGRFNPTLAMGCRLQDYDRFEHLHAVFAELAELEPELACLAEALDSLANYGQGVAFEISPRNIAVKNGQLILLDCFFFPEDLTPY